jgi:transposase
MGVGAGAIGPGVAARGVLATIGHHLPYEGAGVVLTALRDLSQQSTMDALIWHRVRYDLE